MTKTAVIKIAALIVILIPIISIHTRAPGPVGSIELTEVRRAAVCSSVTVVASSAVEAELALEPETVRVPITINLCEDEIVLLARTLYGECRGCDQTEQAAVVWCVLNRVDAGGGSIQEVITRPNQFVGYSSKHPVWPELYALASDVLYRWQLEQLGIENVGRVLPTEYKWFSGDGVRNHFRDAFRNGNRWDWSLDSPYKEGATLFESGKSYYGQ